MIVIALIALFQQVFFPPHWFIDSLDQAFALNSKLRNFKILCKILIR